MMNTDILTIEKTLKEIGVENAERKAQTLNAYMELVLDRNQHVNLTAITERDAFIEKHYADSLAAAQVSEFQKAKTVLDLGTGGGFPGIPLAVAFPEKEFTLADSLNKRIRIIQEFCDELGISNVTAIHGRAEDLGREPDLREHFDVCVSRAVADLRVLSEYCLPFVKVGGSFISYKGADCQEELDTAEHAIHTLGGEVEEVAAVAGSDHQLILIRKAEHTPKKYPRKAGTPTKKPL